MISFPQKVTQTIRTIVFFTKTLEYALLENGSSLAFHRAIYRQIKAVQEKNILKKNTCAD